MKLDIRESYFMNRPKKNKEIFYDVIPSYLINVYGRDYIDIISGKPKGENVREFTGKSL